MFLFCKCSLWHFVAADIEDRERVSCLFVHLHNLSYYVINELNGIGFGDIYHIVGVVLCGLIHTCIKCAVSQQVTHCFFASTHMTWHIYFGYHAYVARARVP